MKRRLLYGILLVCGITIPFLAFAADVPTNLSLTSTEESVTVQWDGDSDADTYNIYWGTTSGSLNQSASVEDPTTELTITGLTPGTQYFIAVSSVDNSVESSRSAVRSITTTEDQESPAAPSGFMLTDIVLSEREMENDLKFQWEANTESDTAHYVIYYGSEAGVHSNSVNVGNVTAATINIDTAALTARYYFSITAVDDSDNESAKAEEVIVDTRPDTLAPFKPAGLSGALAGPKEIKITVTSANDKMADFAGNNIYYGTISGQYKYSIDIANAGSKVFTELPEKAEKWYFSASAYDHSANESAKTDEISVTVEDISLFLDESGDFDGGCFILNAAHGNIPAMVWKLLGCLLIAGLAFLLPLVVRRMPYVLLILILISFGHGRCNADEWPPPGNNTVGLAGGYYVAAESDYRDVYGEDSYPVSVFYDRRLTNHLSIEIESGYFRDSGELLTASGQQTDLNSEIEMVPSALSVKLHFPVIDFITGYVGIGPDYWYVKEEPDDDSLMSDIEEWVGGYHGKIGFKFYNTDDRFKGTGALLETGYHKLDRLGDNDLDIGGWITKFGVFYQF